MAVQKKHAFRRVTRDHKMHHDDLVGERSSFEEQSGGTNGRPRQARDLSKKGNESLADVISQRLLRWTPSLLPQVELIALAGSHDVDVLQMVAA